MYKNGPFILFIRMPSLKTALFFCLMIALVYPVNIERIVRPVDRRKASSSATIRLTYINHLTSWMGFDSVPSALGVPGFALDTPYNYVAHTFWTYPLAPLAATLVWSDLINRMGTSYPGTFGSTTAQIQAIFKANFTNAGVKLLASAFGSTQTPTSSNFNATDCGLQLAQFVKDNNYDGVDIDWEDTPSFSSGDSSGQNWLITLTQVLRANLPAGSIITHAPQAPYFGATLYPKGAYLTVEKTVGSLIDFYNIQFYNQGKGLYETAQNLFNVSQGWCPGTSVNQIIAAGVPASKVVLGKPATHFNAKSGVMDPALLNQAILDNFAYNGWNTGIMFWQYSYDLDGAICGQVGKGVITSPSPYHIKQHIA